MEPVQKINTVSDMLATTTSTIADPIDTQPTLTGVTLIPSNLQTQNSGGREVSVHMVLTPINEDSNSTHSTLVANNPATKALASSVLPICKDGKCSN